MEASTEVLAGPKMTIDVWADVICPWCYIGEERLNKAIQQSRYADNIEVKVHTFQLDPNASDEVSPTLDYLAERFNVPVSQAREMDAQTAKQAHDEGLKYESDRPIGNTTDMLRLVHLGAEYDVAWEYLWAIQAEVFGGNYQAYEQSTLVRIGEELGIPAEEIKDVLATDRYADAVQADHNAALQLGAQGVPFTVLGERIGIPGAASTSQYLQAIEQAWEQVNG